MCLVNSDQVILDPQERIRQLEWQLELQTKDYTLALKQLEYFVKAAEKKVIPEIRRVNGFLYYGPI